MLSSAPDRGTLQRCRGGSLPLKKRSFRPIKENCIVSLSSVAALVSPLQSPRPIQTAALVSLFDQQFPIHEDDKISALAMVAASIPGTVLKDTPQRVSPATQITEMSSVADEDHPHSDEGETSMDQNLPSLHQDPPAGGCHGRSSRHNSFCRRHPCYKGSNYCKLHYRQYVGANAELAAEPTSSDIGGSPAGPVHQDRRYMGDPTETRCLATTTRGRACAYVSVRGTKYCYLHADYDTNPPPRRGGCNTATPQSSVSQASLKDAPSTCDESQRITQNESVCSEDVDDETTTVMQPHTEPLETTESAPSSSSPSETDKSPKKTTSRRTSAKIKEKHVDSPFPLLSMISTDQWSQKKVRVATGPFEGRSGEVKKWGNGWVSVKIPGVGLHNRRSFELYLHPDDNVSVEDQSASLFRCVSRDAASPLPSDGAIPTVTPRPIKSVLSVMAENHAPETPRTEMFSSATTITPSLTQRSEISVPNMGYLRIPRDSEGKGFDMLFETALERNRREIHKPSRYEDAEVPLKKRARGISHKDDEHAEKRPRNETAY